MYGAAGIRCTGDFSGIIKVSINGDFSGIVKVSINGDFSGIVKASINSWSWQLEQKSYYQGEAPKLLSRLRMIMCPLFCLGLPF